MAGMCALSVGLSVTLLMRLGNGENWSATQFTARAAPAYMPTGVTPDAQRFGLTEAQYATGTNGAGALVVNPQGAGGRWTSVSVAWYEVTGPATDGQPLSTPILNTLLGWEWTFGVPAIRGSATEFGAGSITEKDGVWSVTTAPAVYAPGIEVVLQAAVDTHQHVVRGAKLILLNTTVAAGEVSELEYNLLPDGTPYDLENGGASPLQWSPSDVDFTALTAATAGIRAGTRPRPQVPPAFLT